MLEDFIREPRMAYFQMEIALLNEIAGWLKILLIKARLHTNNTRSIVTHDNARY